MIPITASLKRNIAAAIICIVMVSSFFSCKKTENNNISGSQLPDLSSRVNASVSGFVTDENDVAVAGAEVHYGTLAGTTDKYGFFELKNAAVVKKAAVVTVTKAGYFKGIKTFIVAADQSSFCRIKLLPKAIAGTVSSSAGGTVSLPNGLKVALPANAVVNAATKTIYTGQVNIAAQWIDPESAELINIMPGDLRGLNTDGLMKMLTTYGMAAVELTGDAGELLQIEEGKKATLTFPIPSGLSGSAPASLPLWAFDEEKGLWKQEGQATRSGSNYTGDVSHFSFWNCDFPADYVEFSCTLQDAQSRPVPGAIVVIRSQSAGAGAGYTDENGYTSGPIPGNASLLLEVFPNNACSNPIYTYNFTTTDIPASLGVLTIPPATVPFPRVSGTVTNCNGTPVTNGYMIMYANNRYYRSDLYNSGTFNFIYPLCYGSVQASFIAEDISTGEQSAPILYTIHEGNNTVPNLQACGINAGQFVNYTLDGASENFTLPASAFYGYRFLAQPGTSLFNMYISGQQQTPNNPRTVGFTFTEAGIAAGSTQQLLSFEGVDSSLHLQVIAPINVYITEYGGVGEFIAGNFSGTLSYPPPANAPANVTCNFRVRRMQ